MSDEGWELIRSARRVWWGHATCFPNSSHENPCVGWQHFPPEELQYLGIRITCSMQVGSTFDTARSVSLSFSLTNNIPAPGEVELFAHFHFWIQDYVAAAILARMGEDGSLYSSPTSVTRSRFACQLRWVRVGWGKICPLFFDWVGLYLIS